MAHKDLINDVISNATNRRSLLKKLAIASAALGVKAQAQTAPGPAPADVVQFALNLEYLEAEFYSVATTGQLLSARFPTAITGSGTAGLSTTRFNYAPVTFPSQTARQIALNIALDEINHVILLRAALTANGVTPVAKPAINLDALATAGASLSNYSTYLILSRIFEDIGVSAYGGGAQFLQGSPYLTTAARILAVEGEHVANVRLQSAMLGLPAVTLDAADVPPPAPGNGLPTTVVPNYFSTNQANGLTAIRTPGQVLFLAYGNVANATSGGFFPAGMNGVLNTSTAAATVANLT